MKPYFIIFFLVFSFVGFSQLKEKNSKSYSFIQLDYSYGNLMAQKGINHLITGNPEGISLSWNKRTFGDKKWHQKLNYPDIGYSFIYQDFKNEFLGELYGIYGHYNFYFFKRNIDHNLMLSIGTGLGYITNIYHKISNNKNILIGSHLNSSTFLKLLYQKENIINNIGFNAGFSLLHASNGSLKAPNKGVNIWSLSVGLNYHLSSDHRAYKTSEEKEIYKKPNHINVVLYSGFNENDFINTGKKPFFILSTFIDKRINQINAFQLGMELHLHYSLKESNKFYYIFNTDVTNKTHHDWKRASVFIGYELLIGKTAIFSQLGYYIYAPSTQKELFYERVGLKKYINDKLSLSFSVKAHLINAEGLEFGVGYRF